MLDRSTLQLKNYTKLFTFNGEKVEYCLGMERFEDELMFGYSIMDRETRYMSVKKSWFDKNRIL